MPNGDFLALTVWPEKTDPTAEILTVQVRRPSEQGWETVSRLAVYRTAEGGYSQLPERTSPSEATKPQPTARAPSAENPED